MAEGNILSWKASRLSMFHPPNLHIRYIPLLKRSTCPLPFPPKPLVFILMCWSVLQTLSGTWNTYLGRLQSMGTYLPNLTPKSVVLSEFFIAPLWLSRVVDPKSQLLFASALMFHWSLIPKKLMTWTPHGM